MEDYNYHLPTTLHNAVYTHVKIEITSTPSIIIIYYACRKRTEKLYELCYHN